MEAAKQQFDVLKELEFDMASEGLRDACIAEMKSCGNMASNLYQILGNWEKATRTAKDRDSTIRRKLIAAGKEALTIAIVAKIYVKYSSQNYEQYRRELNNGYINRDKEYLITLVEANQGMEYFRPMKMRKSERSGI